MGLVTATTTAPRASVEFVVRRARAEKMHKQHLRQWDRSTAATVRQALRQRRERLEAWGRDRASMPALTTGSSSGSTRNLRGWPLEESRSRPSCCACGCRGTRSVGSSGARRRGTLAPPGLALRSSRP